MLPKISKTVEIEQISRYNGERIEQDRKYVAVKVPNIVLYGIGNLT